MSKKKVVIEETNEKLVSEEKIKNNKEEIVMNDDVDEIQALNDIIISQTIDIHDLQFRAIKLMCKNSQYIVDRNYEQSCQIVDGETGITIMEGELCYIYDFLETILRNND